MKSRLLLLPLALALLAACGKKSDEKTKPDANNNSTAQRETTSQADPIVGDWELDAASLKQHMFERAKAQGRIPADATLDNPALDAQFGIFDDTRMTVTLSADGNWTWEISGGPGGQSESARGTWTRTDAGYDLSRTVLNGQPVEAPPATATLEGDTMKLTMPEGMSMTLNRA